MEDVATFRAEALKQHESQIVGNPELCMEVYLPRYYRAWLEKTEEAFWEEILSVLEKEGEGRGDPARAYASQRTGSTAARPGMSASRKSRPFLYSLINSPLAKTHIWLHTFFQ